MGRLGVLLPAAGLGKRFGSDLPKQFLKLQGRPLYTYSLDLFHAQPEVLEVVFIAPPDYVDSLKEELQAYTKVQVVAGGPDRWVSVQNGFNALSKKISGVLIHDVARPLLPLQVLRACIDEVLRGNSVISALPMADTVKVVRENRIEKTLDRSTLISVQTPQGFPYTLLNEIYSNSKKIESIPSFQKTDEGGILEALGHPVHWVKGSLLARKITEPEDFEWAAQVLAREEKKYD